MNGKTTRRLISIGLLIVMIAIFSTTTNAFMSFRNITNLLKDSAYLGLIALGMAFVIIGGGIDLSAGGIACVVGVLCVRLSLTGAPGILVLLAGVVLGLLFGAINALLITKIHLTEFVATLASGFVFTGLTLIFAFRESGVITSVGVPRTSSFRAFGGNIGGIHYITIIWVILSAIAYLVLSKTKFGIHTYAVGSHSKSAQMSGVNTSLAKALGYLICGGLAGLAVVMQVALNGSSPLNIGGGYEFKAITACVIGGVVLGGGKGDTISAFIGSIFLIMLVNGLYKYGMAPSWEYFLQGAIILVATTFDAVFNTITNKRLTAHTKSEKNMHGSDDIVLSTDEISGFRVSSHESNTDAVLESGGNIPENSDTGTSGIFIEVKGVFKQFSGVTVLHDANLDVKYGEVHALMGENGAGKSTIIKIITGVFSKDAGEIFIDGKHVEINSRQDSSVLGIQVIYQELSLIPALSVIENIFLGQEQTKYGLLDKKCMRNRVQSLIKHYGFEVDPDAIVDTMGMAQRQMAEILKALAFKAKLIIMDEPTSSLTASESEKLFKTIDGLRERGVGILYISHRLEEVSRLADRLTVMRDGKIVGVLKKEKIDPHTITTMMIGREIKDEVQAGPMHRHEKHCLEIRNLSFENVLRDVNFKAYGGEILGIGGLVGSGRTELIRCIFGAEKRSGGTITLNGKAVSQSIKKNIIRGGFGYVPEDRRVEGLVPLLPMGKNITLASYDRLTSFGLMRRIKEINWAEKAIKTYNIRPPIRMLHAINLSGGNQQKVILGRWLSRDPQVLLLDEPTVGVDIGVKMDLYRLLRELADSGTIVVMVSSDLAELVYLSDRILVMCDGRFSKEFTRGNVTQEAILLASSGEKTEEGTAL